MAKRPTLSKAQRWATGATYGRATDLERVIRIKATAINKVLKQCPHLTREQLLNEMGFPENWEKIMRYKK